MGLGCWSVLMGAFHDEAAILPRTPDGGVRVVCLGAPEVRTQTEMRNYDS